MDRQVDPVKKGSGQFVALAILGTMFFSIGFALGTLVDYAESIGLANPEWYAWIAPVGMVVGYLAGIVLIPRFVSQYKALVISTVTAIAGSLPVVVTPSQI